MERMCQSLEIPFRRRSVFPRNGTLAARIVTRFNGADWLPNFVKTVYHANFVDDRDIAAATVIGDCLKERAIDQNIFGAPTFVSNNELFWGNDRLEQAVQWHRRQC